MKEDGQASERRAKENSGRSHEREQRANEHKNRMLVKTTDYLDHFARFKRKENVEAVERLLSAHKELAKFERAQLGSFPSLLTDSTCTEYLLCLGRSIRGYRVSRVLTDGIRLTLLRLRRRSKNPHSLSHRQNHRRRFARAAR